MLWKKKFYEYNKKRRWPDELSGFLIRISSKCPEYGQTHALDKYPGWRLANEENPIVSVAYVPTGNLKNRW